MIAVHWVIENSGRVSTDIVDQACLLLTLLTVVSPEGSTGSTEWDVITVLSFDYFRFRSSATLSLVAGMTGQWTPARDQGDKSRIKHYLISVDPIIVPAANPRFPGAK